MLKGLQKKLRPILRPKRFEAFCVGLPRAGTHSVAAMFDQYRAAHEPGGEADLRMLLDFLEHRITPAELAEILHRRDREHWLEMESSPRNVYLIDQLVELFPEARFVLTIRDCCGWLDSYFNHELAATPAAGDPSIAFRAQCFRSPRFTHSPQEKSLAERGLATLDGYFSYWAFHLRRVLDAVPAERLMVLEVSKLTERAADLAEFVGVPATSLNLDEAHSFKAVQKHQVLAQLDAAFVRAKAEEHCGELMRRYFPGHETTLLAK